MRTRTGLLLLAACGLLVCGCTSPTSLGPVAVQNEENVRNLGDNVARLSAAFVREIRFHATLQLTRIRNSVASFLSASSADVGDATEAQLATPAFLPNKALQNKVDDLRDALRGVDADLADRVVEQRGEAPLIDVLSGRMTIAQVLMDGQRVKQLDVSINATDGDLRRSHLSHRDQITDKYSVVRREVDALDALVAAAEAYVAELEQQTTAATTLAAAISSFAEQKTITGSAREVLGDEELREDVLGIVARKQGKATADRVRGHLEQVTNAVDALDPMGRK